MAGSAEIISNEKNGLWRAIHWYWTSDASGDVSGVGELSIPGGSVHSFWSIPESGVTDNFDLTVSGKFRTKNGTVLSVADLLDGAGANLSNSTDGEIKNLSVVLPVVYDTQLSPVIANAGNAQSGHLLLFVWEE